MQKKNNFWKILFILVLCAYVAIYIALSNGYYESKVKDKTLNTQKQIEKFEEDLKSGKNVDVINYLPERKDYSNFVTKSANAINNRLSSVLSSKKDNIWDFFKSLFMG